MTDDPQAQDASHDLLIDCRLTANGPRIVLIDCPADSGSSDAVAEAAPPYERTLRHIVKESPGGMSWGDGGPGSSDFALSLLTELFGAALAEAHHLNFKWDVVVNLPVRHATLKKSEIQRWLDNQVPA
ncbi:MAG: hypothetical protein RLY93_18415 [Sumerlaeia bacterium]